MSSRIANLVLATVAAAALLPLGLALAGSKPEEPPTPTVLPPDETQLAKLTSALEEAEKKKDDELLTACLIELSGEFKPELAAPVALSHDTFVPHIQRGLKSKDPNVLRYAILAAATHELKEAEPIVLKLLKSKKKGKKPKKGKGLGGEGVKAAAIEYVDRMGMEGHSERIYEEYLRPIFNTQARMKRSTSIDMLRAGLHVLGREKYRPAVPWMIDNLDEPVPANPNSGTNPPASYWEARYKLWQASEGWFRWALKESTGEEYRKVREWKAWLSQNKKEFK